MSLSINFALTKTGQAALFNASLTGYSVNLTHIQIGSGNKAPNGLETALLSPIEAVAIAAGSRVSETQVRMSAIFTGNAVFPINEVGLWSGAPGVTGSVLVAYWSQATGSVAYKSAGVDFVFSHDLAVSPASNITVLADPSQSAMLTLLGAHEAKPDPHPNYTTVSEVQALIEARVGDYVTSTGPANAYVCALVPSVTAYDEKTAFAFKVSAANTGACSLNAGGGVKPLVREDGTAVQAGDLGAGAIATVVYDVATQSFRLTEIVASQINALSDAKIAAHTSVADPHPQYAPLSGPAFTGRVDSNRSRSSANWGQAQFMAYAIPGSDVDFASMTFHVQDAFNAPQVGFNFTDDNRLGFYDNNGTSRIFTFPVSGLSNGVLKIVDGDVSVATPDVDYSREVVPAATEAVQGKVELATITEATTGTDATRAMTSVGTKAVMTAHTEAADPHPQYTTAGELASAINAAASPGRIYFFSQI